MKALANLLRRTRHDRKSSSSAQPLSILARYVAICILAVLGASALPAQHSFSSGGLNGSWVNVDPNTRGLVRIVIDDRKIHPFGACHPDPCDWGNLKGNILAAGVDASNATALMAKKSTNFDKVELTVSLESDGRLRAEVFTHFTDGSGRADYRTVNYFIRGRIPYVP
jgi:hypothetical protein